MPRPDLPDGAHASKSTTTSDARTVGPRPRMRREEHLALGHPPGGDDVAPLPSTEAGRLPALPVAGRAVAIPLFSETRHRPLPPLRTPPLHTRERYPRGNYRQLALNIPPASMGRNCAYKKRKTAYGALMSAYPTFPPAETGSIIGLARLHFSVRNGKRWFTRK